MNTLNIYKIIAMTIKLEFYYNLNGLKCHYQYKKNVFKFKPNFYVSNYVII